MFTGYMILDEKGKELYSQCKQSVGGASLSLVQLVRDRDFPDMRIAFFAQAINCPTVYEVLRGA